MYVACEEIVVTSSQQGATVIVDNLKVNVVLFLIIKHKHHFNSHFQVNLVEFSFGFLPDLCVSYFSHQVHASFLTGRDYSRSGRSPKVNPWESLLQNVYSLDALPVTQLAAPKH